jgi:hypothetical protein
MQPSKSALIAFVAATVQVSAYPALNIMNDGQGYSPVLNLFETATERARHAILAIPVSIIEGSGFFNPLSEPVQTYDECSDLAAGLPFPDSCIECVDKTTCVWNKIDRVCMKKPRRLADKHVTDPAVCQSIYDASPAGKTDIAWNGMKKHVFGEEPKQPAWSGRHTLHAFRAGPGNAHWYGVCDNTSDLCIFMDNHNNPKTVFGNSYSTVDVERICKAAIRYNIAGASTNAWIVNGLNDNRICVQHQVEGTGSCYPLGVNTSPRDLGESCSGEGTGNTPAHEVEAPF